MVGRVAIWYWFDSSCPSSPLFYYMLVRHRSRKHIVTGYSVNGSMRVLGTCSVGSSPAILISGV
ncbi:hypothetical protein N388_gp57 [Lactococcus phage phi7]|uniref:Uncharacterized protein n=1 Tax=Lactococcus phage phi7 TaxID=1262538 RepID=R9R2G5_9CAUD|nr:hypothetical protein N388_gp57 [Lactococcus phage phi7]AGI11236.1 hypothetical protein phi7_0057 [Lactococcus phage phi7]